MSKTRDQFPLSRKKIVKKMLTDIFGSVFSIIVLFFVLQSVIGVYLKLWIPETDTYLIDAKITIIALAIITPAYSYIYQRMFFARYFYDFTDNYVVIRKGVITPREITIPYERIQDVYLDQDLFDKLAWSLIPRS